MRKIIAVVNTPLFLGGEKKTQYQNVIWSLLNGNNNKKWGRISNIHLLQNISPELNRLNVCHKFFFYIYA